jgi:hypothetical protein
MHGRRPGKADSLWVSVKYNHTPTNLMGQFWHGIWQKCLVSLYATLCVCVPVTRQASDLHRDGMRYAVVVIYCRSAARRALQLNCKMHRRACTASMSPTLDCCCTNLSVDSMLPELWHRLSSCMPCLVFVYAMCTGLHATSIGKSALTINMCACLVAVPAGVCGRVQLVTGYATLFCPAWAVTWCHLGGSAQHCLVSVTKTAMANS